MLPVNFIWMQHLLQFWTSTFSKMYISHSHICFYLFYNFSFDFLNFYLKLLQCSICALLHFLFFINFFFFWYFVVIFVIPDDTFKCFFLFISAVTFCDMNSEQGCVHFQISLVKSNCFAGLAMDIVSFGLFRRFITKLFYLHFTGILYFSFINNS